MNMGSEKRWVFVCLFCFFKKKLEEAREDGTDMSISGISLLSIHVHFCLPLSLSSLQLAWYSQQKSWSNWDLPFPERPRVMFPCKPNILTGSEVGDGHKRRMNVQVYSPKEEQALPPNYEQLLNRTEHQQRQKMYVCGLKKCWRLI